MEKIEHPLFSELDIPLKANCHVTDDSLFITVWNWNYTDFLTFQAQAHELIRKNKKHKIYIFCNHSNCFTLGRGNERSEEGLVDFDAKIKLPFELYKIKRGGGITFHHPGQWIFYPILAINEGYTLEQHMCWLLTSVKNNLNSCFGIKTISTTKLMGVWLERKKLASIGVGLNRFVTEHGIALNLKRDEKMFNELKNINPCGMSSLTYCTVEDFLEPNPKNILQAFHAYFLKNEFPFL